MFMAKGSRRTPRKNIQPITIFFIAGSAYPPGLKRF